MATYGQVRMRLTQMFPKVPADVMDGFIWARHEMVMDQLNWDRLATVRPVSVLAQYATGTVTLTQGSVIVIGNGTAWDSATGDIFRIEGGTTYYRFTVDSAGVGTLDRPYEGAGGEFSYHINRSVYALPVDVRIIKDIVDPAVGCRLVHLDRSQFARAFGQRIERGVPTHWTAYFDSDTDPPAMRIEVYPLPILAGSLSVSVMLDRGGIMEGQTSTAFLPWERPGVIQDGVSEDCCNWLLTQPEPAPGLSVAAQRYEAKFASGLAGMIRTDVSRQGSTSLDMDPSMYAHRARRVERWGR